MSGNNVIWMLIHFSLVYVQSVHAVMTWGQSLVCFEYCSYQDSYVTALLLQSAHLRESSVSIRMRSWTNAYYEQAGIQLVHLMWIYIESYFFPEFIYLFSVLNMFLRGISLCHFK